MALLAGAKSARLLPLLHRAVRSECVTRTWKRYVHPFSCEFVFFFTLSGLSANLLFQEETFQQKRAVRIYMPDRLKSLLVDDWENITKNLQLVQMPSSKPAAIILDEYFAHATSTGNRNTTETDILEEVIQGLKEYFNKSLGRLLLYRFEREQFFDILTQTEQATSDLAGKSMSEIYGGEHLLRLFG